MQIKLTYRKTSRLSLRIAKDGCLRVTAPYLYPRNKIEQFIADHQDWIQQALLQHQAQSARQNQFYEQLPLDNPAAKKQAKLRLKNIVEPLVSAYAQRMLVQPSGISYRSSKTRWGSCNVKSRKLNFSLYLLLLPQICIEHIVVHELAHLLVSKHSPAFYAVVDKYFPHRKQADAMAKAVVRGIASSPSTT